MGFVGSDGPFTLTALTLRCFDLRRRMTLCRMRAEASVDGVLVAEAELSAAVVDKKAAGLG